MNGVSPTAWPIPPSRWGSCCRSRVPDAVQRLFDGAPLNRDQYKHGSRFCSAPLRAAQRPGQEFEMSKTFRTLDDVDVKGKRVLLRVDLNVPMEQGRVTDATRLERVAPTIIEISSKGGKVILLSHLGRPKGRDPKKSLKPVATALAEVIGKPVAFADDCIGEVAQDAAAAVEDGDHPWLGNTRLHNDERNHHP